MKPIAYFPQCMWQSMLNITAYLQSLTGFSWDKTWVSLYTADAVSSEKNFPFVSSTISVRDTKTNVIFHFWHRHGFL